MRAHVHHAAWALSAGSGEQRWEQYMSGVGYTQSQNVSLDDWCLKIVITASCINSQFPITHYSMGPGPIHTYYILCPQAKYIPLIKQHVLLMTFQHNHIKQQINLMSYHVLTWLCVITYHALTDNRWLTTTVVNSNPARQYHRIRRGSLISSHINLCGHADLFVLWPVQMSVHEEHSQRTSLHRRPQYG